MALQLKSISIFVVALPRGESFSVQGEGVRPRPRKPFGGRFSPPFRAFFDLGERGSYPGPEGHGDDDFPPNWVGQIGVQVVPPARHSDAVEGPFQLLPRQRRLIDHGDQRGVHVHTLKKMAVTKAQSAPPTVAPMRKPSV